MRSLLRSAAMAAVILLPASSFALDAPKGEVILTITGKLDHPNVGDTAQFDLVMLEALDGRKGTMETPWTTGKVEFSGPLFRAVLEAAGAHADKLKLIALNDYAAEVPVEDAFEIDSILATRMDGAPMPVRDQGPLFLVYPFDQDSSLYNEKYFSRSVWQIKTIEAE
ncbi:molybdopterin-dependent oxidoreductase [Rhizobium leguminosarum]|uniref:molybdopterin-dependent oxidoreductase n=1 Tax=Rhizobium TaxID=379 RepID=UPI0013BE14EC|nr:molybdopterin-dependent oxidoreductase [Rhizobium leguminosarum]MBY5393136.1 molybdopterin-dependent oxidoreductase [Rhizobium leguminosarum]MBY5434959.1 molybdopterin-dependent oxidoreductase [Rhizobium leguminosarum]NEK46799.1 molybdopterin-dependent oxidoreductase [Rhizobium leguminosarum]